MFTQQVVPAHMGKLGTCSLDGWDYPQRTESYSVFGRGDGPSSGVLGMLGVRVQTGEPPSFHLTSPFAFSKN